ncbi:MAG: hypothetical protein H6581_15380 [Bacteroidia bacterium]|nr:hypothetical protein [Bacteroidia bacterium]
MKFAEIPYQPLTENSLGTELQRLVDNFSAAKTFAQARKAFVEVQEFQIRFQTHWTLSFLRMLAGDEGLDYKAEYQINNAIGPKLGEKMGIFYQNLLDSPFLPQLEEGFGRQITHLAESFVRQDQPQLTAFKLRETELVNEFRQNFQGKSFKIGDKEGNFSQWLHWMKVAERPKRKTISDGILDFAMLKDEFLADIFQKMVANRHEMARAAGFENYLQLGHLVHKRQGVSYAQLHDFARGIKTHFAELGRKITHLQEKMIGVKTLAYYDRATFSEYDWASSMTLGQDEIERSLERCLGEISPQVHQFTQRLRENELMVFAGKNTGFSFSVSLPEVRQSFVHVVTQLDNPQSLLTLFHEIGHAYQNEQSFHWDIYDYIHGATDSSEVFSHAMEFLAWKGLNHLFSGRDLVLFKLIHLAQSIIRILRCSQGFELEDFVYSHPGCDLGLVDAKWLQLEAEYGREVDFEGHPYLTSGKAWREFGHFYQSPLYILSYGLATIAALDILRKSKEDPEKAWQTYQSMAVVGGSCSFPELLQKAGLSSPFQENDLQEIAAFSAQLMEEMEAELEKFPSLTTP